MEWHPCFKTQDKMDTMSSKSRLSDSHPSLRRTKLDASYDFGVWGTSRSAPSLQAFRAPEASAKYWKRTVAPFVVERKPRARSIPNFPGFDPARDRNYFDWRPASSASSAKSQRSETPLYGVASSTRARTLVVDAASMSRTLR
eukprot:TRINITY_DN60015_c0_g1_i1.p1 TRINITY_DN60015_c0_g1~~TRINITY_DN60015_c0_g1_i1.p1  ORF type:complete len:143 (+),score=16.16 TRINITY_DN60015_c0_g1_i1:86-514(+)